MKKNTNLEKFGTIIIVAIVLYAILMFSTYSTCGSLGDFCGVPQFFAIIAFVIPMSLIGSFGAIIQAIKHRRSTIPLTGWQIFFVVLSILDLVALALLVFLMTR